MTLEVISEEVAKIAMRNWSRLMLIAKAADEMATDGYGLTAESSQLFGREFVASMVRASAPARYGLMAIREHHAPNAIKLEFELMRLTSGEGQVTFGISMPAHGWFPVLQSLMCQQGDTVIFEFTLPAVAKEGDKVRYQAMESIEGTWVGETEVGSWISTIQFST